ncbi:CBO0543 family protein [Bacillus sp. JJ634]
MNKFQEIEKQYEYLRKLWLDYWTQEVVFTYQWWIMIFVLVTPLFLWWRLVDKTRIMEISMVGLLISIIAFLLDQIGSSLGYWTYPYTLTPLERDLWAVANFSILPFFYMMIYQWFPKWKTYILGTMIFALFAAFIGETIFQWLGIYVMLKWKHIYSVLGYILLGIFVKVILKKLKTIEAISKSKE